ncbi:MAG: hypothetical protein ACKO2K_01200 [Alphaproteobacteria bacterium]
MSNLLLFFLAGLADDAARDRRNARLHAELVKLAAETRRSTEELERQNARFMATMKRGGDRLHETALEIQRLTAWFRR